MALRKLLQKNPLHAVTEPAATDDAPLSLDTAQPARFGLWVLGLGFGGFLLWASLAPLDEGVPTTGAVAIDTKRKAVQHLSGGIVQEVLVREGQFVKAGDPLLKIDSAVSQANYESVRQHYLTLRATEGRLLAEQVNAQRIVFHPDLSAHTDDPLVKQLIDNQTSLFHSRRGAINADTRATQEAIEGQQASIRAYEDMRASRKLQLQRFAEEVEGLREMVKEGYTPRNKQLELERQMAETTSAIADLTGNIERGRRAVAEMKLRSVQHVQEYRKEVDTQLADVRREVQADADKFKAAGEELTRTTIRSPTDGQVVGLAAQTVGGVISPGQKLMDIVPRHETLLLETKVPPHMIDRVWPGKDADVRFSAFAHSPMLVVQGRVDSVSSDLITEPQTNQSYYLARVSLTEQGMKSLGSRQMQAGMPAEVVIRTGERTLLTYLLHPLLKRMAASLKEE